jgi:hypothetical protein
VDRKRKRGAFFCSLFFFFFFAAAIACGLDRKGARHDPDEVEASADGGVLDVAPEDDADAEPDAIADAGFDCGEGGGFCDLCDETLLLCVPFENEVKDKSRYAHDVIILGSPGFVNGPQSRAMEIDAATTLRVAHNKAWEDYSELTIEMFLRPNALPPDGGRAGLVDKNNAFGFFLLPNGDLQCNVSVSFRAQPDGGLLLDGGPFTHVACVGGKGKSTVYARGVALRELDASDPHASNEELAIAGNSPAGDPFIGAIDALRIYKRAKTAKEIAIAADASLP